jgi:hypothetical protein
MFRGQTGITLIAGIAMCLGVAIAAEQAPGEPPPGEGLDLIQRSCVSCHDIYTITTKRKSPQEWTQTVEAMADRGAEVTPDEMQIIEAYLAQNFDSRSAQ